MTTATAKAPIKIDDALMRRCQDGDDQAFDQLVELTKSASYALAYRWTRDRELAFDIVQESYIKLFKFLPRWDYSCKVQTWLYRVVTNLCIDHHRRRRNRLHLLEEWDDIGDDDRFVSRDPSPQQNLQSKEQRQVIEAHISELPERMQQAFRLKYIGGLTHQEISEIQECSIGTIKAAIHQAARKLRLQLKQAQ